VTRRTLVGKTSDERRWGRQSGGGVRTFLGFERRGRGMRRILSKHDQKERKGRTTGGGGCLLWSVRRAKDVIRKGVWWHSVMTPRKEGGRLKGVGADFRSPMISKGEEIRENQHLQKNHHAAGARGSEERRSSREGGLQFAVSPGDGDIEKQRENPEDPSEEGGGAKRAEA